MKEANHGFEQKNKMLESSPSPIRSPASPNRRADRSSPKRELRRRDRYPGPLTIGLIDVDHFKDINARFLLPGGDKVLVDLAKVLTSSLRTVDLLGRIGGEEFMVIAPETGLDGARIVGERIRSAVERAVFNYRDAIIPVRVSIGFSICEEGGEVDYESMKHTAAAALSDAKNTGRNRCVFFQMPRVAIEQAG